jgi:hypothetical protein
MELELWSETSAAISAVRRRGRTTRGQKLKLAGAQPPVRKVFSVTRLDRLLQFADSVEAALKTP